MASEIPPDSPDKEWRQAHASPSLSLCQHMESDADCKVDGPTKI